MSFICRSAASVTGFTFVSPKPHDKVPEPPSPGRGVAPKGETTHYILCVALLLQNVFAVHAIRRRRIGASSPPRNFRCSSGLRPAPFLRKEPSLRAFLPAHTVILSRRRRISVLEAYETIGSKYQSAGIRCFSGLRPAPSQLGKQKEGPFMGRLRANFARLGNPMQDCHLRKEPYVTCFPSRLSPSS